MNYHNFFQEIFWYVKNEGYILPQNFKSIGGFWAVDRYVCNVSPTLEVQLQDEGWTSVIIDTNLYVSQGGNNNLLFKKGSEKELLELYDKIFKK